MSISDNKQKRKVEVRNEAGFHFVKYPIWLMKDKKLNKSDLATYRALLVFADRSSGECYPSQEKIAELSRYSRRTVNKALKRLDEAGYIEREDRGRQTVVRNGRKMVVDKTLLYTINDITHLPQFKNHFEKLAKEGTINNQQLNELNEILKRHPIPSFAELNNKLSEVKHQCETISQGGCETTSHELELGFELEPVKPKQEIASKDAELDLVENKGSQDQQLKNKLVEHYQNKLNVSDEEPPSIDEMNKLKRIMSAEWGNRLDEQEQVFMAVVDEIDKEQFVKAVIDRVKVQVDHGGYEIEDLFQYVKQNVRWFAKLAKKPEQIRGQAGAIKSHSIDLIN